MPATGESREDRPLTPRYSAAGNRTVWLTFDDGPHITRTPKVLDVLARHDIRATFFVIGKNAAFYPAIIKRMVEEGHGVANHTYRHPNLTTLTSAKIREELQLTEKRIAAAMGDHKLFRPPYGAHNAKVDAVVAELGYRSILWNVDTVDWSKVFQPDRWVAHGFEQVKARKSSVVLNHDIHSSTANNLDSFIRRIKELRVTFAEPKTL